MMQPKVISVVIIDDEQEAIDLLEMYLRHFTNVQIKAKETDAFKGLELVMGTLPDLLFLDIDMPGMNGLQVADKIHSDNFHSEIVFTTAHERYAFDALGIEPLDFLTKPFNIEELEEVFSKFSVKTEKKFRERKLDHFIHSQSNTPKIRLPASNSILIVEIKDIVVIKSNANRCIVYLLDGTNEIINRNLNVLIDLLNSTTLFKLNRSTYINLSYLQRLDKKNYKCILGYNNMIREESISRIQMLHFEKIMIFPVIQT